jgi:hypothetical protein
MMNARRPGDGLLRSFPILVLAVGVACTDSTSETPVVDAGQHEKDATLDATPDAEPNDGAPVADARPDEGGNAADGPSLVCEALGDGSCSPAPDPSVTECNGCYAHAASRYDPDAACLLEATPDTVVCTTVCLAYPVQQCYSRQVDGSVEVLLLGSYFEDERFEQETGLTPCDDALSQEVGTAPACD